MYYLCAKTKAFFPMKRIGILSDTHSFWDEKYAEYLGEPGSHFAHKLLHTHYSDRSRK